MILQNYQMASFQNLLGLSVPRMKLAQIVTQKRRQNCATRCEANNKVLQTHTQPATYQKTNWSPEFIEKLETNFTMKYNEKVKQLEEEVKSTISGYENGEISNLKLLELIDNIERLGVGYRFETNIRRVLNKIAVINENSLERDHEEDNLYAVSLRFRLLRQHGFSVSPDFLVRFKDINGCLIEHGLETDIKALLSIYEASYLALKGETDLQDAGIFANEHLLKINGLDANVMDHIKHALDIPLYRRMLRLDVKWYIDAYGKQNDAYQPLLDLAIIDFNMVQSVNKKDLQEASKWWEYLGLTRKMIFVRDRLMELFFCSVVLTFEPQYHTCRLGITKVCTLIAVIDDIYDVYGPYGSLDELEVFTNAVKSWDINVMKYMPEYLQLTFLALYNTINGMCYETLFRQGKNIMPVVAKAWGELVEAFFVEAKWTESNYLPTLEEYLDNSIISVSQVLVLIHGYFLVHQDLNIDATESIEKFHDLFRWSSLVSRLYNDLSTSTPEMEKGKNVNAISCYMHEHSVCEEVAREYIKVEIEKSWRKVIETRLACSKECPDAFLDMAVNLSRFSQGVYQFGDGIGTPDARAKDRIVSLIIEPIKYPE